MAKSAADAIKRDSKSPVNDVWVDDDWKKQQMSEPAIGYVIQKE